MRYDEFVSVIRGQVGADATVKLTSHVLHAQEGHRHSPASSCRLTRQQDKDPHQEGCRWLTSAGPGPCSISRTGSSISTATRSGPLPIAAKERVARMVGEEWGNELIRGWNTAGWYIQPRRVGDRIARLIGAPEGTVVMGDTLSVKVYQALSCRPGAQPRHGSVILSDSGNFPSDLYVAQELIHALGPRLRAARCGPRRGRGSNRRDRGGHAADGGRLPHRPPARHESLDRQGARRGGADDLGPRPFGRRLRGRPDRRRRRLRGGLHLQVPQRRPRCSGLHLCGAAAMPRPPVLPLQAGWATQRLSPSMLDYRAAAWHRADARRNAPGDRAGGARCRPRRLGRCGPCGYPQGFDCL